MAHPHLKEARDGHGAKLRAMTEDYGSASGPKNNISGPTNRFKQEGPEDAVGFGADSTKPRGRADKASRKQTIANPVATLKTGGAVQRAHGGRAGKKKGHGTHVSVIVAPQGGGAPGGAPMPMARPPMPMPASAGAMPPGIPPGAPPPGAGAMPPRPPMAPGGPMAAPGSVPPGLVPRAKGGRVHADKAEDEALIHKTLKDEGLIRSEKERARGGRLPNQHHEMHAGALSGEGRLDKIGEKPKNAGKPQPV